MYIVRKKEVLGPFFRQNDKVRHFAYSTYLFATIAFAAAIGKDIGGHYSVRL